MARSPSILVFLFFSFVLSALTTDFDDTYPRKG